MIFSLFFLVISSILQLLIPLLIGRYVDQLSNTSRFSNPKSVTNRDDLVNVSVRVVPLVNQFLLNKIVLRIVMVISCLFIANIIWMGILWTISDRAIAKLRCKLFACVVYREMSFFDHHKTGELMSRFSTDAESINAAMTNELPEITQRSVVVLGAFTYSLYLSWDLTLMSIALMPLLGFIGSKMASFFHSIARKANDELAKATSVAQETINGIKTIKSFAQEDHMRTKYIHYINNALLHLFHQKVAKAFQRYEKR